MIVWISKYALSSGITKHDAKIDGEWAVPGDPFAPYVYFKLGRDAHATEAAAIQFAEAQRVKKIASLKKQIAKLENMRFGE